MKKKLIILLILILVIICVVCLLIPSKTNIEINLLQTYPHNTSAFTEGLFFHDGQLYESTGKYGESKLYKNIDITSGVAEQETDINEEYFGEGSIVFDGYLYILTWQENKVLKYDYETLKLLEEIDYPREGWGLTTDGKYLIASDGSSHIYFMDSNLNDVKTLTVTYKGEEIENINELEYVNGYLWANVWLSNYVVVIDANNGKIIQVFDFSNAYISAAIDANGKTIDVLNGIAYNPDNNKIYFTGKYWPVFFEYEIIQ